MSRKTFALLVQGESEEATFHEVDGTWVEIFPGVDTFIWSDEDQDVYGIDAPFEVFHVVEGRSGLGVGQGFFEEEAIGEAVPTIVWSGALYRAIEKAIEKYGLSPAYRDQEVKDNGKEEDQQ